MNITDIITYCIDVALPGYIFFIKALYFIQVVVAHTFDPCAQEAEAGESQSLRPGWTT